MQRHRDRQSVYITFQSNRFAIHLLPFSLCVELNYFVKKKPKWSYTWLVFVYLWLASFWDTNFVSRFPFLPISPSGENPGNEVAGTLPMSSRIQMIHIYNIDCSLKSEKKWPKMAIRSGIYSELLSEIFAFNQEREIFVQAVGLKTSNWLQCLIFNN